MAQISRKRLPKEIEEQVFESFYKALGLIGKGDERAFVEDILTKTERLMIPKRFAVALLLSSGKSYDEIRGSLNVTQTTIASVVKTLEHSSGLRLAIEKLRKSEAWSRWWQDIERNLHRLVVPKDSFAKEETIKRKLGHKKKTLV